MMEWHGMTSDQAEVDLTAGKTMEDHNNEEETPPDSMLLLPPPCAAPVPLPGQKSHSYVVTEISED
jgi:hypothetical protein